MAYMDYITCPRCTAKVVYDGAHTARDWLLERFGTDELMCPACQQKEQQEAAELVKNVCARWRQQHPRHLQEAFMLGIARGKELAKNTKPQRKR